MHNTQQSTSRPKILHLITGLNIGGAETMLYSLLSATDRKRFEPVVVSLLDHGPMSPKIKALGIPVYAIGMRMNGVSVAKLLTLWNILRKEKPNLIQTWMYHANFFGVLAGKLAGIKHVVWGLHNSNLDRQSNKRTTIWIAKACALVSSLPSAIVSCSQTALDIHLNLGYRSKKSLVIPNGFDIHTFKPDAEKRLEMRQKLGFGENTVLIGLIARFDPQKDHHNFLRAARCLLDSSKYQNSPIQFVLCGQDVDDNNIELRTWIQQLELESCTPTRATAGCSSD